MSGTKYIIGVRIILPAILIAVAVIALFCLPSSFAHAATYSVNCVYTTSVAANLPHGATETQTDVKTDDNFKLSFVVESGANTGHLSADRGTAIVSVVWGAAKVTFIEITDDGTVQVTTIYGKEIGILGSVHSRATGWRGTEMPSQYYGTCEIKLLGQV